MSTALAIASVTSILKDLLNNGLIDHNVSKVLESEVLVTALPPDRIDVGPGVQQSQLNVFLYHVAPNPAWRNIGLPSRDGDGNRISNPPLALDLHYLLTAYGAQELDAEILLGYGMQLLHETPILVRGAIRRSLAPPSGIGGDTGIPARLRQLATSELAEQFEQIRVIPQQMSTEEMSKLWAAFQARYRPTAAYQISVVLIESRQSARAALPVRARGIYVRPFRQPFITRIRSRAAGSTTIVDDQPIIAGDDLVIEGNDLRGDSTVVMTGGIEVTPPDDQITPERIIAAIPGELFAGIHAVQVVQRIPMGFASLPHGGPESNLAAFVLRPSVSSVRIDNVTGSGSALRSATISVDVAPPVSPTQRATLLMNELLPPESADTPVAYSFALPSRFVAESIPSATPPAIATLPFPVTGVKAARYLVRLQVDGAESPVNLSGDGVYDKPDVTVT